MSLTVESLKKIIIEIPNKTAWKIESWILRAMIKESEKLEADNLRLRKAIEEAPCDCITRIGHLNCCEYHGHTDSCYEFEEKGHADTCWKRNALGKNKQERTNMATPKLIFRIAPARKKSLILGNLTLIRPDGTGVVWNNVTSGVVGKQSSSDCWTRNKGMIPPSVECARPTVVMTQRQPSDLFKAVGEWLYTIWPTNLWSKDGTKVRKSLAVHFDANFDTSPGSSGCIVFTRKVSWEEFEKEMDGLYAAGIDECPLEVIYT